MVVFHLEMPYGVKGVPFPVEEGPLCVFDGETQQVCWGGFLSEFPPLYGGQENPTGPEMGRGKSGEGWGSPPPQLLHPMHKGMDKLTCAPWTRPGTIFALLFQVHSLLQEAETFWSTPKPPAV